MSMLMSGEYTPINPYTAPAGFNKGPSMLSVVRTCSKEYIKLQDIKKYTHSRHVWDIWDRQHMYGTGTHICVKAARQRVTTLMCRSMPLTCSADKSCNSFRTVDLSYCKCFYASMHQPSTCIGYARHEGLGAACL